jgi:hypothetical protein
VGLLLPAPSLKGEFPTNSKAPIRTKTRAALGKMDDSKEWFLTPPGGPSQGRTSLNPRHYLNNHGNRHEQYIRQLINADRYDIKKGTSNVQEKLWY